MKRGVGGIDLDLSNHRDRLLIHTELSKIIVQMLLQGIADGALGIGAADIERYFVQFVGGQLRTAQDKTDLRPVAMPNRHVPAGLNQMSDVQSRLARRLILVG